MTTSKASKAGVTRRGFLAAVGVGAAATAIPAGALAPAGAGPRAHVPAIREWYTRALEQFAEEIRPELQAGTMGEPAWVVPNDYTSFHRLGDAVCERFGLRVTERPDESDDGVWIEGDDATAHLILAVSASAAEMGDGGWDHVACWAQAAVEEDVLKLAAARGWIVRPA